MQAGKKHFGRLRLLNRFQQILVAFTLVAPIGAVGSGATAGDDLSNHNVPVGNVLYTVGTTFEQSGQSYAYLLWMPTNEHVLKQRSFSIWSKAGPADAPGDYRSESWIEIQTNPLVLEGILQRTERLGRDLDELECVLDGLFDFFTPSDSLSRAEKLSVLMQAAEQDSAIYHDLLLMARLYPSISICLGAAWTGPIDGMRTYEIRMAEAGDGPAAARDARRVVGRVTLDPASYEPLPAPGAPVQIWYPDRPLTDPPTANELDPRSHLNVRMRWSTPDVLREQALLQFGYHIYRVDFSFYESEQMGNGLSVDALSSYTESHPDKVKRVTSSPVLIDRMLTDEEATDWRSDPDTYFFTDDNDRFEPEGIPFNDNDRFMYMVTAVDVLGRDGLPSEATWMRVFKTMIPNPPTHLTVRDKVTYPSPNTMFQRFGISWKPPTPVDEAPITRFDILRWEEANDVATPKGPETHDPNDPWTLPVKAGSVAYVEGQELYEFEDTSMNAPPGYLPEQSALGRTWWYTVQAVSEGVIHNIRSPHSASVSGVMRDRVAPVLAQGSMEIFRSRSIVDLLQSAVQVEELVEPDPGYLNLRIIAKRETTHKGVDSFDYFYRIDDDSEGAYEHSPLGKIPANAHYLGSVRFHDPSELEVSSNYRIELPDTGSHNVTLHIRCRDVHGIPSISYLRDTVSTAPDTHRKEMVVTAYQEYDITTPRADGLSTHVSQCWDKDTPNIPLVIFGSVPDDVETWKVFQRIDDGPLVLIKEETGVPDWDEAVPVMSANSGTVTYFTQILDAAGNASSMVEVGHFRFTPLTAPSRPLLTPVETLEDEQAALTWACSSYGVERFSVGVAAVGRFPPDRISDDLSEAFEQRAAVPVVIGGEQTTLDFRFYDTGALLGDTNPEHSVTLDVEDGLTYYFLVEAVSPSGAKGRVSNVVEFAWVEPPPLGGPDVDWPARPKPQINTAFKQPVASPEGIVIGELGDLNYVQQVGDTWVLRQQDLSRDIYNERSGSREEGRRDRRLLPCVVYRYQLPNERFPRVSGDVYQVTPLLKEIAARDEIVNGTLRTVVYDPYFHFRGRMNNILIRIPQPLIVDAKYRYLMVLFNDDGEIDSVVPTTSFTYEFN